MKQGRPTALVTGGAKRIGAAIVRDLAENGFAVAVHHNGSGDEAEELVGSIVSGGGQAQSFEADLTNTASVTGLIEAANAAMGPIDLLVNNASIFTFDTLETFEEADWDNHFTIHLKAPAMLTRALASQLPEDRSGLVVNIIDQRVWRLTPRYFSYTLSKSALWTATQTMAQSLAPGIRVNAIGPGPTMANQRQSESDFAAQTKAVPLQRGPGLEEFGATIRWLWETPSVTGQMIALDGGQHLAWQTPDVTDVGE